MGLAHSELIIATQTGIFEDSFNIYMGAVQRRPIYIKVYTI